MELRIDGGVKALSLGETLDYLGLVFRHAAPQTAGYTDVEGPAPPVYEDVDTGLHRSWIIARSVSPLAPRFRGGDDLSVRVFSHRRILNPG